MDWNSNDIYEISIADIHVQLQLAGCEPATRAKILEDYEAFHVPPQAGLGVVCLQTEPGPPFVPIQSGGSWEIHAARREGRLEFESYFEKGWIEVATGAGQLVLRPEGSPENFLRVLYAWRCLEHEALLLHAGGVIRNGRGYVFFGPSGSGKTTITGLSRAHTILSDDLVILKKEGAGVRVYGVPFRGDLPEAPRTNAQAELVGLFTLVKDTTHRITPLDFQSGVARLTACVPFIMGQAENARRVMEICLELARRVPVRTLRFRRDDGFWDVIDAQ